MKVDIELAQRISGTGWTRRHGWLFGAGVATVTLGVVLQIPDMSAMIVQGPDGTAMMSGDAAMSMWTPTMLVGMLFLVVGMVIGCVALFRHAPRTRTGPGVSTDAIDQGRMGLAYWLTCAVLALALVEDIMKPLTLGFVLPGMSKEYDLPIGTVALLPLVALTGTAVGSIVWGLLGDRYGRRSALLLATLLFVATSACGAMPSFGWNLVMCFAMGCSAGGLLPLAFTLIAELTPRRHRGWMAVMMGSVGGLGGYLAASVAAHYLEPAFSWRVLWLLGLPSGLLLLAMTPLIPESPLFLLRMGRRAQAEVVLRRYRMRIRETGTPEPPAADQKAGVRALMRSRPSATAAITVVGIVWGLANFGFLVMMPTQLRAAGMSGGTASGLLATSALLSAPALALVVLLYAYWSGRRSLALCLAAVALALGGIAVWSIGGTSAVLLKVGVAMLVLGLSAVNAMLLPYCAEMYPTALRATGTGFAAATMKFGGILGPSTMVLMLDLHGGLRTPALVLAALGLVAAVLILRWGRDSDARVSQPSVERLAAHTR